SAPTPLARHTQCRLLPTPRKDPATNRSQTNAKAIGCSESPNELQSSEKRLGRRDQSSIGEVPVGTRSSPRAGSHTLPTSSRLPPEASMPPSEQPHGRSGPTCARATNRPKWQNRQTPSEKPTSERFREKEILPGPPAP